LKKEKVFFSFLPMLRRHATRNRPGTGNCLLTDAPEYVIINKIAQNESKEVPRVKHTHLLLLCLAAMLFVSVGYAALSDELTITGNVQVSGSDYPVRITNVAYVNQTEPHLVQDISYSGTVLSTKINVAAGSSEKLQITIENFSNKTYVFERVIEGKEIGIEGVYDGDGITYSYEGTGLISMRTPLAPKGQANSSVTFTLIINTNSPTINGRYMLDFHFIEKTGTEILPTTTAKPETPTEPPETTTAESGKPSEPEEPPEQEETTQAIGDGDFLTVVKILTSDSDKCLMNTSNGDLILDVLFTDKTPPLILESSVPSIPGGNMAKITQAANANTKKEVAYIFVGTAGDYRRLELFLYYKQDCDAGTPASGTTPGTEILVYRQFLTYVGGTFTPSNKNKDAGKWSGGTWELTGTYEGRAQVAVLDGGGNGGTVQMIDPTTWKAGAPTTASEP
jgi:hypothetical protein